MAITYGKGRTTSSAKTKVAVAVLAGIVAALAAGKYVNWKLAPLLGWDAAALIYIAWVWSKIGRMDGRTTAEHAVREDPSRGIADGILLIASVASLIAVGVVLSEAHGARGAAQLLLILLGIASVVVAWFLVHTVFGLRYAELYYGGEKRGGVAFDGTPEPSYHDFAYLAFTVGMTFQVSDTGFQSTDFRRTALRHALISYLFGTVIVATTINLIAGLSK